MVTVIVKNGNVDRASRTLKKKLQKEGVLKELKQKPPADLLTYAEELEIENASTMRKQDIMFAILKQLAENDGVLEKM